MTVIEASQSDERRNSNILLIIAGLLVVVSFYVVLTSTMSQVVGQEAVSERGNVVEARLGKGTEGLVKQTAAHMSKLLGGGSVGGFPGFEPPDDDEAYREKIRNQSYTGEEADHWIKEINNYLRQVVKKNPNMTLEEILQEMGRQQRDTNLFLDALRDVHATARGLEGYGVSKGTLEGLEALMETLGVAPW